MRPIRPWFFVIGGALALAGALLIWLALFADLPDPRRAGLPNAPAASVRFEDRAGRLLYEAIAPDGNRHVPLPLSAIPLACRQATVATEDSRFYQHPGVDILAILRAAWLNWRGEGPFSGASTISQQLARNLYMLEEERGERTLRRKLREAWLAWRLERRYSKDDLLALYLNTSYYGHFAVGIEAAAQAYFGVHAGELDLAQCALLAGLLQYPYGYNPLEHPEAASRRQATVLGLMARDGYISQQQAEEAAGERLLFAATPFPIEAPHFVMWVQGQLEELLGIERVRAGGLRVSTTLDLDWQRQAEAIVSRRLTALRPCAAGSFDPASCDRAAEAGRRIENAGLVALDPRSGAVLTMVGNADYFDRATSGAVNTTLALRQPGSAIKPLTYALALDPGAAAAAGRAPWTAATLIADLRTVFITAEGLPYVPQNYDQAYHGPVTLRMALANSYNIPAVKALDAVGVDALIELANRLGIAWERQNSECEMQNAECGVRNTQYGIRPELPPRDRETDVTVSPDHRVTVSQRPTPGYGLALTLGGGEVRLLDLTAAYGAFANGGMRVTPFAIRRVETLAGEVVFDAAPAAPPRARVLDPRVAYLISDILSDEVARQPAFGPGSALEIGRPAAVKTGTTTDWRDNWTVGYTPDGAGHLVVGVWTGNADNAPMRGVSGVTGAAPIWHDFMRAVLRGTPAQPFPRPDGLARLEVCADSGMRSAEYGAQFAIRNSQFEIVACPHRRAEWFIAGTEPAEVDRSHVRVTLDVRTDKPATAATPAEFVVEQVVWLLPDEFREWARTRGMLQKDDLALGSLDLSQDESAPETRPAAPPGTARTNSGLPNLRPVEASAELRSPRLVEASPQEDGSTGIALTSPDPNRAYRIDPGLPAAAQKLPITARLNEALRAGGAAVTLLVDGAALAVVAGPDYTAWWPLTAGAHTFEAIVAGADGTRIRSAPIYVLVE